MFCWKIENTLTQTPWQQVFHFLEPYSAEVESSHLLCYWAKRLLISDCCFSFFVNYLVFFTLASQIGLLLGFCDFIQYMFPSHIVQFVCSEFFFISVESWLENYANFILLYFNIQWTTLLELHFYLVDVGCLFNLVLAKIIFSGILVFKLCKIYSPICLTAPTKINLCCLKSWAGWVG